MNSNVSMGFLRFRSRRAARRFDEASKKWVRLGPPDLEVLERNEAIGRRRLELQLSHAQARPRPQGRTAQGRYDRRLKKLRRLVRE